MFIVVNLFIIPFQCFLNFLLFEVFLLTKSNHFLFWQPVYAPTDAIFDENHELAAVRECNSHTD